MIDFYDLTLDDIKRILREVREEYKAAVTEASEDYETDKYSHILRTRMHNYSERLVAAEYISERLGLDFEEDD